LYKKGQKGAEILKKSFYSTKFDQLGAEILKKLLYSTKFDQLYRFIARKIILSRNLCRFIKGIHKFGPI